MAEKWCSVAIVEYWTTKRWSLVTCSAKRWSCTMMILNTSTSSRKGSLIGGRRRGTIWGKKLASCKKKRRSWGRKTKNWGQETNNPSRDYWASCREERKNMMHQSTSLVDGKERVILVEDLNTEMMKLLLSQKMLLPTLWSKRLRPPCSIFTQFLDGSS